MLNKRIQFYNETFQKLIQIVEPIYLHSEHEKKKMLCNSFWEDSKKETVIADLPDDLDDINHLPLFSVDGKMWTIQRFRAQLKRNPLVLKDGYVKGNDFSEQFKLAITDMTIDYFITQDAYTKGYDQIPFIDRQINL